MVSVVPADAVCISLLREDRCALVSELMSDFFRSGPIVMLKPLPIDTVDAALGEIIAIIRST